MQGTINTPLVVNKSILSGCVCTIALIVGLPVTTLFSSTVHAQEECSSSASDPDGDGWGWEDTTGDGNENSCQVPTGNGAVPECIDSDGDGFGWNGTQTCDPNEQPDPGISPTVLDSCIKPDTSNPATTNPREATNPGSTHWNVTTGTCGEGYPDVVKSVNSGSRRGTRAYCHVSHFAYDDPIVKPATGHLHMFWGNTATVQGNDLAPSSVSSTCDGGIRNLSSYWMPALYVDGNIAMPAQVIAYYKTFNAGDSGGNEIAFPDNLVQDIPDGLQMLARKTEPGEVGTKNWNKGKIKIANCNTTGTTTTDGRAEDFETCFRNRWNTKGDSDFISFTIEMPNCLSTDNGQRFGTADTMDWMYGTPFVGDNDPGTDNDHLAYSQAVSDQADHRSDNHCPTSHPYRIPSVELVANYTKASMAGDWKLASDLQKNKPRGTTLHGDYIASWKQDAMDFMVNCNMTKSDCEFGKGGISDRDIAVWGESVYGSGAIYRGPNLPNDPLFSGEVIPPVTR